MRVGALVLLAALAAGCQGCRRPLPAPARVGADAEALSAFDGGPATCLDLCRYGQRLGCTWAADTNMGESCATVCANNQAAGIASWDLDCRIRQTSCPDMDAKCR